MSIAGLHQEVKSKAHDHSTQQFSKPTRRTNYWERYIIWSFFRETRNRTAEYHATCSTR